MAVLIRLLPLTKQPVSATLPLMQSVGFTFWQDGEHWLGYLDDFPDYMTQGAGLYYLKDHLLDLHKELSSGAIPGVRRHAELVVT